MARRTVEHYVETCDFCKAEFRVTSEDPSMLKRVYAYHYGGYGDQERIVRSLDACGSCYSEALAAGYGDSHKAATYIGSIKR